MDPSSHGRYKYDGMPLSNASKLQPDSEKVWKIIFFGLGLAVQRNADITLAQNREAPEKYDLYEMYRQTGDNRRKGGGFPLVRV
jgi:hypothetical protein